MRIHAGRAITAALAAALALSACGGGGGASGEDTATTTTAAGTAAATPSAPAAAPPPVIDTNVEGAIPKDEYILRADALCAGLDERFGDFDFEYKDRAEIVRIIETLGADLSMTVEQLQALPTPIGDPTGAQAMLASYRRAARALQRLPKALDDGGSDFISRTERIDARVELGSEIGNVRGWRYGFRTCATQPVASFDPEADGAALALLQAAREAQVLRFVQHGAFTERRLHLLELEGLSFVTRLTSLQPGNVYVELADTRTMYLGVESDSGRCLWLRAAEPPEGSDGEQEPEVTYSVNPNCASRPAAVTFVGNRDLPPGCGCGSPGSAQGQTEQAEQVRFD